MLTCEQIEELKKRYPEGTMVELKTMKGEARMSERLKGTVKFVDDIGQIHVKWKNGSSLALNVEEDVFSVITTEDENQEVYGGMMTIE